MTIQPFRPLRNLSRPAWDEAGIEPSIAEMLADPIVHLVMRRDGLERADVEGVVARARCLLRSRLCDCCAA